MDNEMLSSSNGRVELIDWFRGGAMILVLLQHTSVPVSDYLLAFHMPLFFMISGYLEAISSAGKRKKKFAEFLKSRFIRLMIPYFCFEFVNLVIWYFHCAHSDNVFRIKDGLVSIIAMTNTTNFIGLYGRLWFFPCMFVAEIITYFVYKYFSNSKISMLMIIGCLLGLSWFKSIFMVRRLPFTVDTALMASAFILMGYVLSELITSLICDERWIIKLILIAMMMLYMVRSVDSGNAIMLMYNNIYGDFTFSILAALCGCFTFLVIFSFLWKICRNNQIVSKMILWYGRNSLAVFPVHLTIKMLILNHIPIFSGWILMFLIMLIVSPPIVYMIDRFLPFMVGKRYRMVIKTQR